MIAGLLLVCAAVPCWAAIQTVGSGVAHRSPAVRHALQLPTRDGRVEALITVLTGPDLPAAQDAMVVLATYGPVVVPRLVSELHSTRNNWLVGGVLVRMGAEAVVCVIELLEDADEAATVDLLYLLGEIQDRRAVPTLERYLDDPRREVRKYAVSALLDIGGPRAVEAVLDRLAREGRALSGFIVENVVRHGSGSFDVIVQTLASGDTAHRREAAYLLGRIADPSGAGALVRALSDDDAKVRENAAYALGALAGRLDDPGPVVEALAGALADAVEAVVDTARRALVAHGEVSVPPLIRVAREGRHAQVVAALNALRAVGSSDAETVMIERLQHGPRSVRVAAVAGLVSVGTSRSVDPLVAALRNDDLRWFAGLALERLGPEKPGSLLGGNPSDPSAGVRIELLVRLGSRVVPYLLDRLYDPEPDRRASALWVLGAIGDESAAPPVARLLEDPEMGSLAALTLGRLGVAGREEALRHLRSATSETGAVRAVEALAACDDGEAWQALEEAVSARVPRVARVRAAVLLSIHGDPERIDRLRAYLDAEGRSLWPEVETALRAEGGIEVVR